MNYKLDQFLANDGKFKFLFDDGSWVGLDLSNKYPNYKVPNGNLGEKDWHFTVIDNNNNPDINIGDIKLFNYEKLKK